MLYFGVAAIISGLVSKRFFGQHRFKFTARLEALFLLPTFLVYFIMSSLFYHIPVAFYTQIVVSFKEVQGDLT